MKQLLNAVQIFVRNSKGVAALEFIIVVPFLLALLLLSVDGVMALSAQRKATIAANTIADIAARQVPDPSVTTSQQQSDLLNGVGVLGLASLAPFSGTETAIRLTTFDIQSAGDEALVRFVGNATGSSAVFPTRALCDVQPFNPPLAPNTLVIFVEVNQPFNTLFGVLEGLTGINSFNLQSQAFFTTRTASDSPFIVDATITQCPDT